MFSSNKHAINLIIGTILLTCDRNSIVVKTFNHVCGITGGCILQMMCGKI